MKIRTKNSAWVSGLTLSLLVAGGYHTELMASDYYGDVETFQDTQVSPDGCEITAQQQHMLDLINAARSQEQNCGDELYQAAAPLTWSCQLGVSASKHTKDMATYNFFGHTGSDGLRAGDRLFASGYDWSHFGENISAGFVSAEEAMEGFLESPTHCKNIMNPDSTVFGSYMIRSENLDYSSYWTQLFSAPM